jgi:membrane protease YdiL (CAAX protease family)
MSQNTLVTESENPHSINRSPITFFLLVFGLSVPFWILGAALKTELLPGLPVSSLMVLCPLGAAMILVYRETKINGLSALLKRSIDFNRVKALFWYIPILLLMPFVTVLSYAVMRILQMPLPDPQLPGATVIAMMFLMFILAAWAEELGWTGYAIDPLQARWGTLPASLLLGLVWAVWHVIPFMQVGRSPTWMVWQCLTLVAQRVILVWIYNQDGKSVASAILFHCMINVSWQLFPNNGSHYDPRIYGLVTIFVTTLILVIGRIGKVSEFNEA